MYGGVSVKIAFDAQGSDEASRNSAFREASERNADLDDNALHEECFLTRQNLN